MFDNSFQKQYLYENISNNEDKYSLVNTMKEYEKIYKIPSTINNKSLSQNSTDKNSTIIVLNNELKEKKSPYMDKNIIPEIKIKDESNLTNGEKIETYIKYRFNPYFDDNIYNNCEKCRKNDNNFFCEKCLKNLCKNCSKICQNNKHKLIDLQKRQKEIKNYRKDINRIISEYFIEPEKKEKTWELKEQKIYQVFDENKINENENIGKFKEYTNDILLIKSIIDKNYNNYFHCKNIENCYKYMKKKYDINNQILIEYGINSGEKEIKIFGEGFVFNNIKKVFMIFEGEEYELSQYFELKNKITDNILKIKLICIDNVTNMNWMFSNCTTLISLSFISNLNTNNVTKMSGMFYNCTSLTSLPDIQNLNTSNATNINRMFHGCTSLNSLPDISNWNMDKVTNIRGLFTKCTSLNYLPDISKWNTKNVINLSEMFSFCTSLISLPDISKWNTNNVMNMRGMFDQCTSLISLPDISKWNTNNVTDMSCMFSFCISLNSLPDISNWDTNKVNDISNMFYFCVSLNSLPDISKWNTNKVSDMREMFFRCTSLSSLPNVSKWNINNVINMNDIISGCISLEFIPSNIIIEKNYLKKLLSI